MLAIRLQRVGRRGHASFRVIVQDSRWSPKSGKFVAHLGSYDPHSKTAVIKKDETELYLKNGAQPSDRVAKLLKNDGIKLPKWFSFSPDKKTTIKNPDKLRKNQAPSSKNPETEKPTKEAETDKDKSEDKNKVEEIPDKTPTEEKTTEKK